MASLVARHSRKCAHAGKELAAPERGEIIGCTCKPTFGVRFRDETGRNRCEPISKDRKTAIVRLNKLRVQLSEGEVVASDNVRFSEWADTWRAALERPKENTRRSYKATMDYATEAFGQKIVRKIRPRDVAAMNELMRKRKVSDSTRAKHLRVLSSCFDSAIDHGLAAQNPVKRLPKSERPRPAKNEAAYFTNDELPRLVAEIPEGLWLTLFLTALKTGMRAGELLALTWGDLDLTDSLIRVRRNFTAGRVTDTKNHEARNVDLTAEVVTMLGEWWGACDSPGDSQLVFPREAGGGFVPGWALTKQVLYPAMKRAGVPRVGPTGTNRTFHSFRHTFAKLALENGRQVTWLSRHMGHSTVQVTTGIYGHWERAAAKAEAEQMAGVFGV